MRNFASCGLCACLFGFAVSASADIVNIVDTTLGTATNDGGIVVGEYVGFGSGAMGAGSNFGNVFGTGSKLHIDSSIGGVLSLGFEKGSAQAFNNVGVMYIDSVPGGFTSTTPLNDNANDNARRAISGHSGAELVFPAGFEADYAIAIEETFAGLFKLIAGNDNSLGFVTSANLDATSGTPYEMNLTLANIGSTIGGSFKYFVTYINGTGTFRSSEFHGLATAPNDNIGGSSYTMPSGSFNTFQSIPEPGAFLFGGMASILAAVAYRRRK